MAIGNPKDSWSTAAAEAVDALGKQVLLITTHEVCTEFLASFSEQADLRRTAVEMVRGMLDGQEVKILSLSHDRWRRGLERYECRPDKEYSLVDCISMVAMEEEGITEVLTNDHHFEQEGFRILVRRDR